MFFGVMYVKLYFEKVGCFVLDGVIDFLVFGFEVGVM